MLYACCPLNQILRLYFICGMGCCLENLIRLSVEVMVAVGQGGGRGSTLLYSLRFWPERLQAVAPGCCHFAPATWIHRQPDPWLTLQVELASHPLQYFTIASCLPDKPAQFKSNLHKRACHCLLQSEKNNNA